jgi:hypothetical protein
MSLGGYVLVEGVIGVLAVTALALWLGGRMIRRARHPAPQDIDYDVLEAAEREMRDGAAGHLPAVEEEGDDWGPGTYQPGRR